MANTIDLDKIIKPLNRELLSKFDKVEWKMVDYGCKLRVTLTRGDFRNYVDIKETPLKGFVISNPKMFLKETSYYFRDSQREALGI